MVEYARSDCNSLRLRMRLLRLGGLMNSVRIETVPSDPLTLLIDVVCDCGNNGLTNDATGERSFRHAVRINSGHDVVLVCVCGRKYRLHPQSKHIHVYTKPTE